MVSACHDPCHEWAVEPNFKKLELAGGAKRYPEQLHTVLLFMVFKVVCKVSLVDVLDKCARALLELHCEMESNLLVMSSPMIIPDGEISRYVHHCTLC